MPSCLSFFEFWSIWLVKKGYLVVSESFALELRVFGFFEDFGAYYGAVEGFLLFFLEFFIGVVEVLVFELISWSLVVRVAHCKRY